jgi:hypothetical protein
MKDDIKNFLWLWGCVIIANQLFFFGACFKPHCIFAAIPQTLVLAVFFFFGSKKLS